MSAPLDTSAVQTLPPFDPTFADVSYAELSHGRTGYRIFGEERPGGASIVCMHGIGWWSFCFDEFAASVAAAGHRCLIFDFFGRGSSAVPSTPYAPGLFVEQTRELLDHIGWRHPVHLVGISMGGAIATHFTVTYPDRVASVTLLAPAVTPVDMPFVARLALMPYIGSLLFALVGQRSMLKRLRELRCADDILRSDDRPELVNALIERMEWAILNKPGYPTAFHSTMASFDFAGECPIVKLNSGRYVFRL
eukprot:TRINITY_DN28452_c0_g1_i1.p1 TRINITY_DN28452_c0_g1~~TRINITY_DN28452_c0_g1_i1.p1  ORF type:complete len:250 (-),score=70.26 TRINITY_DN28452_c0_g1_i1:134-883(-)